MDETSAVIATVIVSGIATLIAGVSLVLSYKANRTSNAALDETRRRNVLDRRPSLVVVTSPDEGRGRNYSRVHVQNSGPGVAHKVRVSLTWESLAPDLCQWGDKPVEASVNSLPEQRTLELPREAPCPATDKDRIWGTMTCEDGAGTRYWWRRVGPDADWQSETGFLPDDS